MNKIKGVQLGAMLVAMLLVGMAFVPTVNAESPTLVSDLSGNNSVSVNKALEHARVYMLNAVLTNISGLEEWRGAMINPEPLTLYDINGEKLFYEFSVEKNGTMVGTMKISASRELGSSLRTLEIGPHRWNASVAIEKAKEIAQQKFNGEAKIISTELVVYGYPKIGVMVTLADQSGGITRMFIDAVDYSIIPDKKPEADRTGVWSIYERIPKENKSQRIDEWNRDDKYVSFVMEKANSMGIGNLAQKTLSENELNNLEKQGKGMTLLGLTLVNSKTLNLQLTADGSKTLNVPLYGQSNSVRCCVASAQMIAAYYGVSHTQDHIASVMGCGNTGGCFVSQELTYYQGATPNGLGKTQSWDDTSPTWIENKNSIDQNKPLRSGLPTHCRVSIGWWQWTDPFGYINYLIRINDPWQPSTYWENWGAKTHVDDLYVI